MKKVVNFAVLVSFREVSPQQFDGEVYAYEPIYGTGGAVVSLTPSPELGDKEFDEDDVEVFQETVMYLVSGGRRYV